MFRSEAAQGRLWSVWLLCCMCVNFKVATGVFTSQIFIMVLLAGWWTWAAWTDDAQAFWVPFGLTSFVVWVMSFDGVDNLRLLPELVKMATVVFLPFAVCALLTEKAVRKIAIVLPAAAAGQVVLAYLLGTWDYYDPVLHRFGVPSFGSPNTTAFVLAFALILLQWRWRVLPPEKRSGQVAFIAMAATLCAGLMATQSRGGMIIAALGLFVGGGRRLRIAIGAATLAAALFFAFSQLGDDVGRLNVVAEVRDTGGSGRSEVWAGILHNVVTSPKHLIVGVGPGSIHTYLDATGTGVVVSAHSTFMEILNSYGLVGMALLGYALYRIGRTAMFSVATEVKPLRQAIAAPLLLGFALDSYPLAAQLLWLTPLLVAIVFVKAETAPREMTGRAAVAAEVCG